MYSKFLICTINSFIHCNLRLKIFLLIVLKKPKILKRKLEKRKSIWQFPLILSFLNLSSLMEFFILWMHKVINSVPNGSDWFRSNPDPVRIKNFGSDPVRFLDLDPNWIWTGIFNPNRTEKSSSDQNFK
jgi:hypothetical protein